MYCSFNQRKVTVQLHVSLSAIVYLVGAIEVGVAYLPFFACLSTPHRLLGGVLGLLYTLTWYMKTLSFLFVAVAVKTFVGCRTDCQFFVWFVGFRLIVRLYDTISCPSGRVGEYD